MDDTLTLPLPASMQAATKALTQLTMIPVPRSEQDCFTTWPPASSEEALASLIRIGLRRMLCHVEETLNVAVRLHGPAQELMLYFVANPTVAYARVPDFDEGSRARALIHSHLNAGAESSQGPMDAPDAIERAEVAAYFADGQQFIEELMACKDAIEKALDGSRGGAPDGD